ncbi:serine protease [Nocardioides jejuensis]|uniref:Serine protease n=2 Tax=Nocardioides jejuensis TaxID=2502782 RepID=A0A4R1CLC4_9ACTN|nr:serine protease [Nocardioides jejuensis]
MFTGDAQCTANFVFTDDAHRVYVGYAAHCAGTGDSNDINGCTTRSLAMGTPVTFGTGAGLLTSGTTTGSGRLVYSSWHTMQARHEKSAIRCAYNDFALVRVDAASVGKVNPSMPKTGGPVGLDTDGVPVGSTLYTYGASSMKLGGNGSARTARKTATEGSGWEHVVRGGTGIPGDSGSGYLGPDGRAVGVLSTLAFGLSGTSNGVGDLSRELAYAQAHAGISGLRLVPGTVRFHTS